MIEATYDTGVRLLVASIDALDTYRHIEEVRDGRILSEHYLIAVLGCNRTFRLLLYDIVA